MKNLIIVLNYNDYKTTIDYIEKIKNYASIDKIIVVDNASTDGSYEKLKHLTSEKVDIILNPKNEGYAKGNNFGIEYANEKYQFENLIISNPDIIVEESSIKKMSDFLDDHYDYAAVTGLIYNLNGQIVKNFAWKQPRFNQMLFSSSLLLNKLRMLINKEYIFYNIPSQLIGYKNVDVLSGCFFMIKNSVMKEIGNFDSDTFLYHEENLLFYKVNRKKYKSAVLLEEKITHFEGVSVAKSLGSYLNKAKFMKESADVYLNKALNISLTKQRLFNFIFQIGTLEKYAYIKYVKNRK